jgi:hypothetical protein
MSDTVTIEGVDLDIEDTREALDTLTRDGDEVGYRVAMHGSVVIAGDGFTTDDDIYVANREDVEEVGGGNIRGQYGFTSVAGLRNALEDAERPEFVEFVADRGYMAHSNQVDDGTEMPGPSDAVISYNGNRFDASEMQGLAADEDIALSYTHYDEDDDTLYVGVEDQRDE